MAYIASVWIWLGIIACITVSAIFSGLNLAIFSLSQLRLQAEVDSGNEDAARVLDLRKIRIQSSLPLSGAASGRTYA